MTSKRELKKDIKLLTETIIGDAVEVGDTLENEKDQKKALDVVMEVIDLHNGLIEKINHPDGKENPKMVKKHYKSISKDLMKGCDKAYEKLSKLVPEK